MISLISITQPPPGNWRSRKRYATKILRFTVGRQRATDLTGLRLGHHAGSGLRHSIYPEPLGYEMRMPHFRFVEESFISWAAADNFSGSPL
jgi:hypothetical protein